MSDYLNYLDEVYTDLVAEYGEGITLAYHEANVAEMWGNSHRNTLAIIWNPPRFLLKLLLKQKRKVVRNDLYCKTRNL